MKIATVELVSLSPYSQSRPHTTPKRNKENAQDYETRTWPHRLHLDDDGVLIPAMAFKNCLSEAAKFLSLPIPGKGKETYTKHFDAGVLVTVPSEIYHPKTGDRIVPPSDLGLLAVKLSNAPTISEQEEQKLSGWKRPVNEVWGDWIFTPSTGVPGSGKRVWRCYPMVDSWSCKVTFNILDDTITEEVFKKVLTQAGQLIGLGRFRVRNRGTYGRFAIASMTWQEMNL